MIGIVSSGAAADAVGHLSGYEIDILIEGLRHRFDNRTLRIAHPDQYTLAASVFTKLVAAAREVGTDGGVWNFYFGAGAKRREPDKALCDGPSCLPLDGSRDLLASLKAIHAAVQ